MTAIALAIFSPSLPKISSTINLITGLIVFFILLLLVILLDIYLKERKRKDILEEKIDNIIRNLKEVSREISFLKEIFKTIEDLSGLKTKMEIIEKKVFKK